MAFILMIAASVRLKNITEKTNFLLTT